MTSRFAFLGILALQILLWPVKAYELDTRLPQYQADRLVSGKLSSVGSDSLANLMAFWAERFNQDHPNVVMQLQTAGSSTAPPALTEGTAQLGPMSRKMKDKELQAFYHRFGYRPIAIRVAIDALSVFVNKDNPIKGLTIKQVDAIFSSTLKCGANRSARHWGELGLSGDWEKRDIQIFGRNSVSGTYGYFKLSALCRGDFRNNVNEQPGSASVVQSVSTSLNSIGYSGIGYRTSGVRVLPLAQSGDDYIAATMDNAINGRYPLARFLYLYVNKKPGQALDPLVAEFIKMVLSYQGQFIVQKDGYIPLPLELVKEDLAKLGLE
ncbi:PstS family phosphate ABC transporter substrate-binding protein [Gayadomonas joobiniege]|uniref:PstS family phosphate ABC transporter substrate-binding protein n=1 Tax=Gayadomonas joobiniege TaxID=1234606 RepID=UPI0003619CBE|nr:phosphate ABC transporter substrate-binding protein [Gayadomonas joobiniege]